MILRPLLIRAAILSDAPRLAELSAQLGYPGESAEFGARLQRLLGREDMAILVAEEDGTVIGWLHGARVEILEYGPRCEIMGLVIDRERRRSGAGGRLLAAIESWATSRGLTEMGVRSNVTRVESHPFYEKHGYARVKTQHSYRKRLDG